MHLSRYVKERSTFKRTNVLDVCREERIKEREDNLLLEYKKFNDALKKYQKELENDDSFSFIPNMGEITNNISSSLDIFEMNLQKRVLSAKKVLMQQISQIDLDENIVNTIQQENTEINKRIESLRKEQNLPIPDIGEAAIIEANSTSKSNELKMRASGHSERRKRIDEEFEKLEKELK